MKKITLLTFTFFQFFISPLAQAHPNDSSYLECFTKPAPTTSFFLYPNAGSDQFDLTVIHHNGLKYAPIHRGIVTLNDLNSILQKGETLALTGEQFHLSFERENCRVISDQEIVCHHSKPTQIGELDVRGYTLHTYTQQSQLLGQSLKENIVTLSLGVKNTSYDIVMNYSSSDCLFQL